MAAAPVELRLAALEKSVAELERQNAALRAVVRLSGQDVVIQAPMKLQLVAGTSVETNAGSEFSARAGSGFSLRGGSTGVVEAGASLDLRGSITRVNNGSAPAARVGSNILNGKVNDGSASLLVP